MTGKLIVIEGIDGSGKTTISKMLLRELRSRGIRAVYTYEPINKEFIDLIEIYGRRLGAEIEALLLAADRYVHVRDFIVPNLRRGYVIICDRYFYSSIAYQGARGADVRWIRSLNKFAVKPNIAIYLDVRPEIGISRIKSKNGRKLSYLEDISVLRRVREIYLSLVNNGELVLVNAEATIDEVFKEVYELVIKVLECKN